MEDPFPPFLLGLDLLPALAHAAGRARVGVAEDVRVPADELLVHSAGDRLQLARTPLLEQQRQEVDLEEQVTELSVQLGIVARDCRVGDLVGLLERVRNDRPRRLLPIPGALATELQRQILEVEKRVREAHSAAS